VKITEARANLGDLVRAAEADEDTIITQHGKPRAVLVSFEQYEHYLAVRDAQLWERLASRREEETVPLEDVIRAYEP